MLFDFNELFTTESFLEKFKYCPFCSNITINKPYGGWFFYHFVKCEACNIEFWLSDIDGGNHKLTGIIGILSSAHTLDCVSFFSEAYEIHIGKQMILQKYEKEIFGKISLAYIKDIIDQYRLLY